MNNTQEAKPASPPRDLTAVKNDDQPHSITLNWQPPKFSNGQIIGKSLKIKLISLTVLKYNY